MPVKLYPPIHHRLAQTIFRLSAGLAGTALVSCSHVGAMDPVTWITPYKMDVIQGNFVASEQVEQLRAGMSREQVRALLGTPLVASLFHANRWDYVFTLKRQGVPPQSFKYSVFFKDDVLDHFAGDAMPSEADFVTTLANKRKLGEVPVLEATPEQLKAAASGSAASTETLNRPDAPAPAARVYPPLESAKP